MVCYWTLSLGSGTGWERTGEKLAMAWQQESSSYTLSRMSPCTTVHLVLPVLLIPGTISPYMEELNGRSQVLSTEACLAKPL